MTGVIVDASIAMRLRWSTEDYPGGRYLLKDHTRASFLFVQVVAYAGLQAVGGSQVLVIGPAGIPGNGAAIAQGCGFTPTFRTTSYAYYGTDLEAPQSASYGIPGEMVFNLQATGVTRFAVVVKAYSAGGEFSADECLVLGASGGTSSVPIIYDSTGAEKPLSLAYLSNGASGNIFRYSTPNSPRSGAALGKASLLSSKHSPADYLIGWAKLNGLVFMYDNAARKVALVQRQTFFQNSVTDISDRVDQGQALAVTPLNILSKWYDFRLPMAEGAFAKEYLAIYGVDYGIKRVDTGYDFDAAAQDILAGSPFRGAVSKLAHGPFWNIVTVGSAVRPSVFLEEGAKYTLWADGTAGTTEDDPAQFDVPPLPANKTLTYYNPTYNGYDIDGVSRLELCDADGKGVDGEDILVTYEGVEQMGRFHVTDDNATMLQLNGKPCWWLTMGTGAGEDVPTFSRYHIVASVVERSLDFGTPREVDIPGVSFAEDSALYERAWAAWMADRLDADTKVLRCRMRLDGMQVGQGLLRPFYWLDGVQWALNKITNYSLTTWDATEVELVLVRDTDNYTSGQEL